MEEDPAEEDAAYAKKEYEFNPLQAEKELKIGQFYLKRRNHKAAKMRFVEATRWNPTAPEGFLRLAEVNEKLKDNKAAVEAYSKYLELAPDGQNVGAIRKRVEELRKAGG